MPNWLGRTILYLSSYFPLFAIFVLLFWGQWIIVGVGIAACILGGLGLWVFLRSLRGRQTETIRPIDVRRSDSEAMSYIVSYILPFVALSFEESRQALALLVFFVVLGIIYVNSNMIHINPVLNVLRYSLYEISLENGQTYSLLARGRVVRRETIVVARIDEDIFFSEGVEG